MSLISKLFSHNWLAIFYFNFKMLPFRQAIYLPFDFYYGIRFENLTGKVVIDTKHLRRGLVKIGGRGSEMFSRATTIIDLKGIMHIGGVLELGHGSLLRIEDTGIVKFGDHVRIGAMSKIFCSREIAFGNEIDFSWECQILDSNLHLIRDLVSNTIDAHEKPILIGSYNWIGNRVTVMKGTKTPDHFIVSSYSLCNSNYAEEPEFSIFGGIPAKKIAQNKQRIFENLEDVSKLIPSKI